MSWEAGPITTNLNPGKGLNCKAAVKACFSKVGYESLSNGHFAFELMMIPMRMISMSLFGKLIAKET